MEPLETTNDENSGFDADDSRSVDDFIRELEEKEKDLDISADLVIEVGDSEVEHDNIHDSFVASATSNYQVTESVNNKQDRDAETIKNNQAAKAELAKAVEERDELRNSLHRQKRDFDNYRQRTERERHEMYKGILGNLAEQMLPVLDNLNRALDATSVSTKDFEEKEMAVFFEGIVLVNQQLNEVLAGMGVEPIASVGKKFDPNFHEAVATEQSSDYPPQTVVQELLRGYRIDQRVIRASMVKVSAAATPDAGNQSVSNDRSSHSQEDE